MREFVLTENFAGDSNGSPVVERIVFVDCLPQSTIRNSSRQFDYRLLFALVIPLKPQKCAIDSKWKKLLARKNQIVDQS